MDILPRFYVYVLCRPDGRPFYVGKGQGDRIGHHEAAARNGHKSRRYSIIRKIWREGGEVFRQKVFTTDDENMAYAMEQALIAAIGRKYLANESDGGEGNRGYRHTEVAKARIAKAMTGRELSAQWHTNVQAAKVGKPRSEACKAKIRANLTGRKLPPEHVAAVAAANRGKPWSAAERASIPVSLRVPKPNARGEKHHSAVLTADQVREIRRLRWQEGLYPKAIAERLGINRSNVKHVLYDKRAWQWLDKD